MNIKPQWTQDEAISFEAAKECIGHWIAIHTEQIFNEKNKNFPDLFILKKLTDERLRLCEERRTFNYLDKSMIEKIRGTYGPLILAYNKKNII